MASHSITLLLVTLTLANLVYLGQSSDPDPIEDFCIADLTKSGGTLSSNYGFPCKPLSQVTSGDFVFSGLTKPGNTTNLFGVAVTLGSVDFFPAINTLGISANRVDFAPGGILPPHSHPRATELITVIHGTHI